MHKDFSSKTFLCCLLLFGLILIGAYQKKKQIHPFATRADVPFAVPIKEGLIHTIQVSDTLKMGQEGEK